MSAEIIPFETIIPLTEETNQKLDEFCARTGRKRNEVANAAIEALLNNPDRLAEIARQLAIESGDPEPEAAAKRVREWAEKKLSERNTVSPPE